MQAKSRQILIAVSVFVAAIAVAGVSYLSGPADVTVAAAGTPKSGVVQMVGVATGEMDQGAPVYRLPTVTVAASRAVELARIEREDAAARAAAAVVATATPAAR
jgi:hypothetical protein